MVFLEEERERELEQVFDKVQGDDRETASIMRRRDESDMDGEVDQEADGDQPQSEAAVKRSVLSVSSGDRIMEALERADQELKEAAVFRKSEGGQGKTRMANPLLLGLEPAQYILWILRSIKSAELEQSLLVLPLGHMERLIYYLIVLLRSGRGVELCSRVAIFMIKTHQNQLVATRKLATPLRELRRLVRMRLSQDRDTVGFNLAALRTIARVAQENKISHFIADDAQSKDIWAGLGLGSDVAAALEQKGGRRAN
jgi:U3 small nucleolar RNA-associated protein 12